MQNGKRMLEFQGLSIGDTDDEEVFIIDEIALKARESSSAMADPIPMLPERVRIIDMNAVASAQRVPVGFAKTEIQPVWHNLGRSPYMLVLGNDDESLGMYLRGLLDAYTTQDADEYRFVDMQHVLNADDNVRVLTEEEEVVEFVEALYDGSCKIPLVVFTSIVQTINGLPAGASQKLQDYITQERGSGVTSLVAATEMWRARSLYQEWYKVITSAGNGVWVGGGFSDQTIYRFARSLPEYRLPAERSDGFYVMRGNVTSVRLLEAVGEPGPIDY